MRDEITLEELKEFLKRYDEVTLLEVLNIDSELLINRFSDEIEDKYEELKEMIDELNDDADYE